MGLCVNDKIMQFYTFLGMASSLIGLLSNIIVPITMIIMCFYLKKISQSISQNKNEKTNESNQKNNN